MHELQICSRWLCEFLAQLWALNCATSSMIDPSLGFKKKGQKQNDPHALTIVVQHAYTASSSYHQLPQRMQEQRGLPGSGQSGRRLAGASCPQIACRLQRHTKASNASNTMRCGHTQAATCSSTVKLPGSLRLKCHPAGRSAICRHA